MDHFKCFCIIDHFKCFCIMDHFKCFCIIDHFKCFCIMDDFKCFCIMDDFKCFCIMDDFKCFCIMDDFKCFCIMDDFKCFCTMDHGPFKCFCIMDHFWTKYQIPSTLFEQGISKNVIFKKEQKLPLKSKVHGQTLMFSKLRSKISRRRRKILEFCKKHHILCVKHFHIS